MEKITLYDFQKKILEKSKGDCQVAYYLDMGLGKTFVGSEKLKELGKTINLLVCQKSKIADWVEHFKAYYDYKIYNLSNKKEYASFCEYNIKKKTIAIINYDLVFRRNLSSLFELCDYTLMLDESSLIQNLGAKRTQYILWKLKPHNVILLSGTPVGGKYENLYSQLYLLGYKEKYKTFFSRFIRTKTLHLKNGRVQEIPYGYKNEKELKELMLYYNCYFLKTDEVIDLPSQNFINVNLPKPEGYDELKAKPLNDTEHAAFVRLIKLRQMCGLSKEKAESFEDLITSSQSRFIVFYCYNEELEIIKSICKKNNKPLSFINGAVKDLENYEEQENSITLIQYQAGAMGLNLQKANKIIFYSPTFRSELYEQAKKRIHRIGQKSHCFYYLLKCGFDYAVYNILEKREDYTNKLFIKEFNYEKK